MIIQGSAGTTEDQILYSRNATQVIGRRPQPQGPGAQPHPQGMVRGAIVRFEEITRCAPEVQDLLVAPSEKCLAIPEPDGNPEALTQAKPGFNLIATANIRDRGAHEMRPR